MKSENIKQVFKCYIKTLSPVHIGCDEVYEPTGFVMTEDKQHITVSHPVSFISNLSEEDRKRFSEICSKGTVSSLIEIYKFLRNRPVDGRKVEVCNDFVDHYRSTLSIPTDNERRVQQELNKFSIHRTAFLDADQRPYIPGSGIKGALRTAYLNLLAENKQTYGLSGRIKGHELEKKLMDYSGIQDDPFRLVKVSDFRPVGDIKTRIVYGVNEKKRSSNRVARGIPLIFEVIQPSSVFEGVISVEKPVNGTKINKPVSMEQLLKGAVSFYCKEKEREMHELQVIGVPAPAELDNERVLLRCGRHNGAESLTINGFRSIKIMGKRGERSKFQDSATTFWLASEVRRPKLKKNLQPFGWVCINELTDEDIAKFSKIEKEFKKELSLDLDQRKYEANKRCELKTRAEETEKKKQVEAEQLHLEEEKRKIELEAMSPEERSIVEVMGPSVTENRVVEIFNTIEEFSDDNKIALAKALKQYWEKLGKWKKKKCTSKQWNKVKKIKEIIGEA